MNRCTSGRYMWLFKHECLGLNSDPHVCMVSTLPNETLSRPKLCIRISFFQKTKCEVTFVMVKHVGCIQSGVGIQVRITALAIPWESYSSLICSRACLKKITLRPFKVCFIIAVLSFSPRSYVNKQTIMVTLILADHWLPLSDTRRAVSNWYWHLPISQRRDH